VKIGAAAWITAVSPEAEEPERDRVVEHAQHDQRTQVPAERREPATSDQQGEQDEHPDDEPAEDDDGRLELVHAELDEHERRAPDRGEEQKEGCVAAGHVVECERPRRFGGEVGIRAIAERATVDAPRQCD
jgi:hypothetical protein